MEGCGTELKGVTQRLNRNPPALPRPPRCLTPRSASCKPPSPLRSLGEPLISPKTMLVDRPSSPWLPSSQEALLSLSFEDEQDIVQTALTTRPSPGKAVLSPSLQMSPIVPRHSLTISVALTKGPSSISPTDQMFIDEPASPHCTTQEVLERRRKSSPWSPSLNVCSHGQEKTGICQLKEDRAAAKQLRPQLIVLPRSLIRPRSPNADDSVTTARPIVKRRISSPVSPRTEPFFKRPHTGCVPLPKTPRSAAEMGGMRSLWTPRTAVPLVSRSAGFSHGRANALSVVGNVSVGRIDGLNDKKDGEPRRKQYM